MENENENLDSSIEETTAVAETAETSVDATALQQKVNDLAEKNKQLFERAKKAEGFEKKDGKWLKVEKPVTTRQEAAPQSTTDVLSELDETSQLYLTVKGIEHDEDVGLMNKWRKETGRNVRAIESNPIFQSELKALRTERVAQEAIPSSGNRSTGTQTNSEDYWYAKYRANDALPEKMPPGMATKLVNRRYAEETSRSPKF